MPIVQIAGLRHALANTQWARGIRTALSVGLAMLLCLLIHHPMGWAALGALYLGIVDNGGPYRTRLGNMLAVMLLGSFAILLGSLTGSNLALGLIATFTFCFSLTLARVLSQPIASASVLILICYVVAYGGSQHTLSAGAHGALDYLLGALWASALALVLWPLDPFRPARAAIADVYASLLQLAEALPLAATDPTHFNDLLAHIRLRIETAQSSLAATPARMTARTIRARNLTVLTESADLLLARILRAAELGDTSAASMQATGAWLTSVLQPIESALRQEPLARASAFAPDGSLSLHLLRSESTLEATLQSDPNCNPAITIHLINALRDALLNLQIAYEAVRAIWTGAESRQRDSTLFRASLTGAPRALSAPSQWLETLRSNLTLRSVMFRHALRLAAVVTVDLLLLRLIHVTHGYWLAMTSLIVLRPFAGETVRRSAERVAGTVAGGILAAAFTAAASTQTEVLILVVLCASASVALIAVDYAWYCFFVTPAIVLLTLPRLHDLHLAVVRMELTLLGAAVALFAMLLLWPERESLQLPGLLARAAAADAAYLRALPLFWQSSGSSPADRIHAERTLLAPARRLCGLAVNDAEETLDHALLEHSIPLNPRRSSTERLNSASLTFTTYLRRITRTATTLAAVGLEAPPSPNLLHSLAQRLETLSVALSGDPSTQLPRPTPVPTGKSLPNEQLDRLARQVSILERTTAELLGR
jgi:uncharacterized membrane protein YccC